MERRFSAAGPLALLLLLAFGGASGAAGAASLQAEAAGSGFGDGARAAATALLPDTLRGALATHRASPESEAGSPVRPRLMALGGVSGLGADGLHPYGGLEAGALKGRFGGMALGQYGDGSGFTSLLLAGGPAFEAYDAGFASLTVYVGGGWYREELDVGFARSTGVVHGALALRVPLPRGAAGMTFSLWRGSVDGPEFGAPAAARSHRFSFGLGL